LLKLTVFNFDFDVVMMDQHVHHLPHLEPPLILGTPVRKVSLVLQVLDRPELVAAFLDA
jgi:hypothetical protein